MRHILYFGCQKVIREIVQNKLHPITPRVFLHSFYTPENQCKWLKVTYLIRGKGIIVMKEEEEEESVILMEFCWLMGPVGGWVFVLDVTNGERRKFH